MRVLEQFWGTTFDQDQIELFIAGYRGKPLHILEHPLSAAMTGCCIALPDADLILMRTGLSPERKLIVRLHECGHFLLGHIPHISDGCEDYPLAMFLEDIKFDRMTPRSPGYLKTIESETEALARALARRVREHEAQRQTHWAILKLHGIENGEGEVEE